MTPNVFQDAPRAGLHYLPFSDFAAALAAAKGAGLSGFQIQAKPRLQDLLADLGSTLHFPDWYGKNLDALYDCLTDCREGQALFIAGLAALQATDAEGLAALLDVLAAASDSRREGNAPLWVLVDTPAPSLPSLP